MSQPCHLPHPDPITTPRLHLRAAHPSDLPALHALLTSPEIMHYWSTPPHTSLSQSESYLKHMIASPNNGVVDFILELRCSHQDSNPRPESRTVIGKAGVWSVLHLEASVAVGEVGFLLAGEYWGRGLMGEALRGMVPRFWSVGLDVVRADVDPRNMRSLGFLRKCGFLEVERVERTLETHLGWCDSVFLELWREEDEDGFAGRNRWRVDGIVELG